MYILVYLLTHIHTHMHIEVISTVYIHLTKYFLDSIPIYAIFSWRKRKIYGISDTKDLDAAAAAAAAAVANV